ncbi:MAG: serine/threonine protein kinase [Verrucomicrobiales bacterium]|jgi:serine/threonine protein kinase
MKESYGPEFIARADEQLLGQLEDLARGCPLPLPKLQAVLTGFSGSDREIAMVFLLRAQIETQHRIGQPCLMDAYQAAFEDDATLVREVFLDDLAFRYDQMERSGRISKIPALIGAFPTNASAAALKRLIELDSEQGEAESVIECYRSYWDSIRDHGNLVSGFCELIGIPGPSSLVGEQNEYRLEELVGVGGAGCVFRAIDLEVGREVAIKFLHPRLGDRHRQGLSNRVNHEVALMARLDHPNVAQVFGIRPFEDTYIIVMQFVPGSVTLREMLDGAASAVELIGILSDVADALAAVHEAGLVFRDLKPSNVLVRMPSRNSPARVYLTDFGLALPAAEAGAGRARFEGTPRYAAVEQLKNGEAFTQSDVYSFGCILYEALAGTMPFEADSFSELTTALKETIPQDPQLVRADVPSSLSQLALRCLLPGIEQRPVDGGELRLAFETAQSPIHDPPPSKLRFALWIGVASIVLICASFAVGYTIGDRPLENGVNFSSEFDEELVKEELIHFFSQPHEVVSSPSERSLVELGATSPDYSPGIETVRKSQIFDMRGWKQMTSDSGDELVSAATMITSLVLKKTSTEADKFYIRPKTSGLDVYTKLPGFDYHVKIPYEPRAVGNEHLKERIIIVDVSDKPVDAEFLLKSVSTYWNSMQADDQWAGALISSSVISQQITLIFPEVKPFTSYKLMVSRVGNQRTRPIPLSEEGSTYRVVADENYSGWIYLEILKPKIGHVYQIFWDW